VNKAVLNKEAFFSEINFVGRGKLRKRSGSRSEREKAVIVPIAHQTAENQNRGGGTPRFRINPKKQLWTQCQDVGQK